MKNAVLFLVLFVHQLTAQTEFPFLNGTTLQSKEILTSIYQERIALLNINQTDSIQCVLSDWKNTCEMSEPLARTTLLLMIQNNQSIDSLGECYFQEYVSDFILRTDLAKLEYYSEVYECGKASLSYVPLRSSIDEWSHKTAETLLKRKDLTKKQYLLCLLFTEEIDSFVCLYK